MKTTFKLLALCGVLTTILALSSCRDQDFDWESAKKANSEYNYAQNFSQIYGSIDPNQSWDFSYWGRQSAKASITRASGKGGSSTLDTGDDVQLIPSTVETSRTPVTITDGMEAFMKDRLMGNNTELESGYQFTLQVPYSGFTIIPVFYCGPHMTDDFELHMVIDNGNGTANDYTVWCSTNQTDIKLGNGTYFTKQQGNGSFDPSSWSFKGVTYGDEDNSLFEPQTTMYFYIKAQLKNGTKTVSSLNKNMIAYYIPDSYLPADNKHEYLLIGCEVDGQGGQYSLNDFIFLIQGEPFVPSKDEFSEDWKLYEHSFEKRYMVEDMGFTKITSTTKDEQTEYSLTVNQQLTDIDFNDIVIDLKESESYLRKLIINSSGIIVKQEIDETSRRTNNEAVIRALGGTWDFKLYIGNSCVFQKSNATACSNISFNPNYSLVGDPTPDTGTTVTSPISSFSAGTIYNTNQTSANGGRGDNHYQTKPVDGKLDVSWLCKFPINIKTSTQDGWDSSANNIRFVIIDGDAQDEYFDSANDDEAEGKSVHILDFPQNGAYPKIIAFDVSKPWQKERHPVNLEWFNNQVYPAE